MDYVIALLIVAVGGWTEWRFRQLGRNQAGPTFQCYYCKEQFSVWRRERIGHYDYCPEHGNRRKREYLADLKESKPRDNGAWIHPTNGGVKQPDNSEFPWLS